MSSSTLFVPSTSSKKQNCLICGDKAISAHFGAISCRACAAFFRRKVLSKKPLLGYCDEKCDINTNIRRLCAKCRYNKCLRVGMKQSAVLSKIARARAAEPVIIDQAGPSKISIHDKLLSAYNHLEDLRKQTYNRNMSCSPKACNYKEMNEIYRIDHKLLMQSVIPMFNELSMLKEDQQNILLSQFLSPFVILEGCYKSIEYDGNYHILPDGNFVDINNIDKYYSEHADDIIGKNVSNVMRPYWKYHQKTIKSQIMSIKLDLSEFLFLCALIFWDTGLPGQMEESIEISSKMRQKILRELDVYENELENDGDPAFRIAQLLLTLPQIQKSRDIVFESFEVTSLYNYQEFHKALWDLFIPTKT